MGNKNFSELIWVVSAQIVAAVGGFIGLKLLTNLMLVEQFGLFQLGWSVALVLATCYFNPIGQSIIRIIPTHQNRETAMDFFESCWIFLCRSSLFGSTAALLLLAAGVVMQGWILIFGIGIIAASALHGLTLVLQHSQTALRQRASFLLVQIFLSLGRPLAAVFFVIWFAETDNQAAYALLGASILLFSVLGLQLVFIHRGLNKYTSNLQASDVTNTPNLFEVAKPMIFLGMLTVASLYTDRWILYGSISLTSVGIYTAIHHISSGLLNFVQGTANRFALPIIFRQFGSGPYRKSTLTARYSTTLMIIVWLIVVTILAATFLLMHKEIVLLLTTPQIAAHSSLLPILFLGLALERTAQVMTVRGNLSMRIGRYATARILHIIVLVTAGVLLVQSQGIFGLAWAQVLAGIVVVSATTITNIRYVD